MQEGGEYEIMRTRRDCAAASKRTRQDMQVKMANQVRTGQGIGGGSRILRFRIYLIGEFTDLSYLVG